MSQKAEPEKEGHGAGVDFPSLLMMFFTTALVHLGEIPDPITKETKQDLGQAQKAIDILSLLETKTKGNLTKEEEGLLQNLLFELRMKYLHAAKLL